MIRLCNGEVYTLNARDYNEDGLIDFFSDDHESAMIQLIHDNGSYAGIVTCSVNRDSREKELNRCPFYISLGPDLFDNAHTFFEKTGLSYCPILNEKGELELFCYDDEDTAWHELETYVAQINEMKNPAGILEDFAYLNLWGLNEIGYHLAVIFRNSRKLQLCCIGEYWDALGFTSEKRGRAGGYDILLEGNYAIPVEEMGFWKHDAVDPALFEDFIERMKRNIHSKHAYGERFCSVPKGRALLYEKIKSGRPFCSGRLGNTEGWIAMKYLNKMSYDSSSLWWLYHTSGFFSQQANVKDVDLYAQETIDALANTDMLFSQFDGSMCAINRCLPETSPVFPMKGLWHDNPALDDDISWVQALEGKRVLVISPFSETVRVQYEKRELLFKGNQIMPEFKLIPYQMISTQYGNKLGFKNFFDAYASVLEDISGIDFDIALIGAGAYGFLLASDIKNMGRQSVELCSYLMPLFGIKIKRHLTEPYINQFYNSHWIFPLESPPTANYRKIENGCYWR